MNREITLSAPVTTRFLAAQDHALWAEFVANSPDGSVHSLPAYLDALCAATGDGYRILAAERDGRLAGGIALYQRRSPFGMYVSPRTLLYYNGLILARHTATSPSQRTAWHLQTLAALERSLAKLPYARLRFKCRSTLTDLRSFDEQGWALRPTWSYVAEISDLSALWSRVHKDQRRLIERCRERGLQVTVNDDFDAFHRLHVQTHQRKGAPLYLPLAAFRRFVETLQGSGLARLYHARLPDGRVAASQLVLTGPHPVTHSVAAATDADFLKLGVSAFLRWSVFEDLAGAGYHANDLTDAALNQVTRFKSQLGGELVLCLQVSRPDRLAFRAGQFASALTDRVKQRLARMRAPSTREDP